MALELYNTLSRKKETFVPIKKGHVGIYGCGPTVYWYAHIGATRRYIMEDVLVRTLLYNDYKIKHVINVTDVGHLVGDADVGEDKMEQAAKKEGRKAEDVAKFYFDAFLGDLKKINFILPDIFSWATKHIPEQIALIKILEKKGYTYKTSDGIYFDTSKFKNYGKMARLNKEEIKAGARVEMREKKNPTDFALWKFSEKSGVRQQEWDSPWSVGFPGWHIECSAMSMKYLGETLDIHIGGIDNMPIHHTNEIAQSECATGKKFVNYWLHCAFLVDSSGNKISKSTGGLYTISELEEKGYNPLYFRYLCLQTHYRKQLQFSLESLDASKNAYEKIKRKVIDLKKDKHTGLTDVSNYEKRFIDAINDDLNTSQALEVFWSLLDDVDVDSRVRLKLLLRFDSVLGIGVSEMKEEKISIPKDVKNLINAREKARNDKDWGKSDKLRNEITKLGYSVEDTPEGQVVRKV